MNKMERINYELRNNIKKDGNKIIDFFIKRVADNNLYRLVGDLGHSHSVLQTIRLIEILKANGYKIKKAKWGEYQLQGKNKHQKDYFIAFLVEDRYNEGEIIYYICEGMNDYSNAHLYYEVMKEYINLNSIPTTTIKIKEDINECEKALKYLISKL